MVSNKKDPAWKYGVEIEIDGKKYMRCTLCDKVIRGGVYRIKEHLAGIKGNVAPCKSVPSDVRDDIKSYMENSEKVKRYNQLVREEKIDKCMTLNSQSKSKEGSGSGSVTQRGIRGPMDRFLNSVEDYQIEELGGIRKGGTDKELRDRTCDEIGRFFFENGIAFNVADSPSFVAMIRAVGRFGTGLKPPTSYELRTSILRREEENTETIVAEVKKTWVKTGVSILSDGWKDIRGRQLINFLVNSPYGTVFLRSVDVSDAVKDAALLFRLLDDVVEEVGEDIVVQVVTDNASNYKKAGEMLMEKRKRLWWTPCAAHCIDLMLEKLGELPQHRNALRKAKKVTNFIYNHGWVLALMRKFANKELVRPAPTRFATAYLTLQSISELRQPLQHMFTSSEWEGCSYANKPDGKEVKKIILTDLTFWEGISYALKTTRPLVHVLRIADSEKVPAMGFIYGAMDTAKEEIAKNLGGDVGAYSEIWKIIDDKWEFQMHRHLHAAAYFLNPQFQYSQEMADYEIKWGLYKCMDRVITDDKDREKADLQVEEFKHARGMFGITQAKNSIGKRTPAEWWSQFGDRTPELRSFAVKILSLTCSSSACERNWSAFNMIHTKRRNRLATEKLNSLVYIMYNRKLRQKFEKLQCLPDDADPLVFDDVPSDNEWVTGEDVVESSGSRPQQRKRIRDSRKGKGVQSLDDETERDDIPSEEENDCDDDDDDGEDDNHDTFRFHFNTHFRPETLPESDD